MLWGLGVGYVISGMYFGWNLGLEKGGTLGFAIATFFIVLMYLAFTFSYTELACSIPKAGGAFDYAHRAFGKNLGFLAGMAAGLRKVTLDGCSVHAASPNMAEPRSAGRVMSPARGRWFGAT